MQYTKNTSSSTYPAVDIADAYSGLFLYVVLSKYGANLYIQYMHCTEATIKRKHHIDFFR